MLLVGMGVERVQCSCRWQHCTALCHVTLMLALCKVEILI